MVVNWINGMGSINVISLRHWLEKIQAVSEILNDIQFIHILREVNMQADALSKRALFALEGRIFFRILGR